MIRTDQWQMKFIWALIFALGGYYVYYVLLNGGLQVNLAKIPGDILNFSNRPGLKYFIVGIFVMNVPIFVSNMSMWQRISGTQQPEIVEKGVRKSIWGIALSWGLLSLLACFAYMYCYPN